MKAEGSQQQKVARHMRGREKVASGARRIRRFVSNKGLDMAAFFAEWSGGVVRAGGGQSITLLVDETKIHDRLGVMMVGIAWEKRCLPIVWQAYRANDATTYPVEGQVGLIAKLLERVKLSIPDGCQVLVLADRGIGCSPELCRVVDRLGWHHRFRRTCATKL